MYYLYGSLTSPFVRRLRLLLHDLSFELKELNIYAPEGNAILEKINPIKQIPVLTDGDQVIWDSRNIYRYLCEKHHWPKLSWDEENCLTAIERGLDSGITLFLLRKSEVDLTKPMMYKDRQLNRMDLILNYLKPWIESSGKNWNFHTMTLYCWLDWANFREILNINNYPFAKHFLSLHAHRPEVIQTQIPNL
jgi:glutathione S-transferase